jgi:hypothetical protein
MFRAVCALTLVVIAVAGCGGADLAPPAGTDPANQPTVTAMPAGTYTSVSFQPTVTFTVPDGWVRQEDSRLYLSLYPADNDLIGIHLFRDPRAASQDASCPAEPEAGVGGTSSELATWIAGRPGLVVGAPTMATVGGLRGVAIDVALKGDWTQACPFSNGVPAVPLINSPDIDHWVVVGNERLRLFLLDLPGGGVVAVDVDAFDGTQIEDLLARSNSIVRSLQFATDGAAGSPAPSQ